MTKLGLCSYFRIPSGYLQCSIMMSCVALKHSGCNESAYHASVDHSVIQADLIVGAGGFQAQKTANLQGQA